MLKYNMLTIICGEDIVASRNYFQSIKKQYTEKNYEIRNIKATEITELKKWLLESISLFAQKKAFFIENLMKYLKRLKNKEIIKELEGIAVIKDVDIFTWEESLTSRDLKSIKGSNVKEFKLSQNIFKLLDALAPGQKLNFLQTLNVLSEETDENFIFIMLARHTRNLLLIKQGITPAKMQSWQAGKLKNQANSWNMEKLIAFYESLFRLDVRTKTSTNAYTVKKSLEILSCHYL